MNDVVQGVPADGVTAGMLLRRARESAGLHVATLAVSLKVPVRKLEALEEDRYDLLADAVFTRALASSVCRTLKIEPQPVLERLPQSGAPRLGQDREGLNAPFRAPGDGAPPSWIQQLARPVPLAVAALLLGALVIALLPGVRRDEAGSAAKNEAVMPPGTPAAVVVPTAEPAPAEAPAQAATMVTTPVATPATAPVAPAVPAAARASAAAATPVGAAPVQVAPATPVPAPPTTGTVVFKAKGQSWVQVTDASGNAVLRRLMEAGETAGASGAMPLSVTVGSVKDTDVMVRGKPYNLGPVSRDNVARFEVK